MGPALLQEAKYALAYGEKMVAKWLQVGMFKKKKDATKKAAEAARHFNDASAHKSHGRRIDRDEARKQHLVIEDLETNQDLQDAVLTAYHLITITFEKTPIAKLLVSHAGRYWVKNVPNVSGTTP
jgi:hypothetical protein